LNPEEQGQLTREGAAFGSVFDVGRVLVAPGMVDFHQETWVFEQQQC
jgi:hypothetical protein